MLVIYGFLVPPFIRIHKITERYHENASAVAYEMFSSVHIVVAFGAEAKLARQHEKMLEKAAGNERRAAPLIGLMMSPNMIAMYGTFAISFWFGIKQYTEGKIPDVGAITVVLFSVMMAVQHVGRLASPIIAIAKAASAATELFATIDAPTPDTSGIQGPDITGDADIVFENVAFSYPGRPNVQVLDDLNLTFETGKVTAIVGPSGSGKSTIISLIQRWYELLGTTAVKTPVEITSPAAAYAQVEEELPCKTLKRFKERHRVENEKDKSSPSVSDEKDKELDLGPNTSTGTIRVRGTDLRKVDLKWWRAQIGLVQQEPFLFNDTLYNNVVFGLCGTRYEGFSKEQKMKMVKDACRKTYAEEFILSLPQGYDTLVGESGIKLSGGQRQRIAIARSIIKRPPILILDEATSAIDVRMERIVQQALDRVSKNRTTIVIAHRLSTIRRADKIVVLRQGKLIEQGTHDELMSIDLGVYRGLVATQSLALEAEEETVENSPFETITNAEPVTSFEHKEASDRFMDGTEYKPTGLFNSFGLLLFEQRKHWVLYSMAIVGILTAGAVHPLLAYVFANVIQVFTYSGERLVSEGNFYAGMFGVLAAGTGVAYFILGIATHLISVVLTRHYRQEYLISMIRRRIPFFDDVGHNPGSLTSRLSSDCV